MDLLSSSDLLIWFDGGADHHVGNALYCDPDSQNSIWESSIKKEQPQELSRVLNLDGGNINISSSGSSQSVDAFAREIAPARNDVAARGSSQCAGTIGGDTVTPGGAPDEKILRTCGRTAIRMIEYHLGMAKLAFAQARLQAPGDVDPASVTISVEFQDRTEAS